MARAYTASVIVAAGLPASSAATDVHFPVPFCPAASRITSTRGCPVSSSVLRRMSAVISIR